MWVYVFLAQVLPCTGEEFERAYPYAKRLLRRIGSGRGTALDLSDELELTHLRLADRGADGIGLHQGEHEQTAFAGTGQGTLTDDDKIFLQAVGERMSADETLQRQAAVNDIDTFRFAFDDAFLANVLDAMEHNSDLGKRLLDDTRFADVVRTWMLRYVHRRAAERHDTPELPLEGTRHDPIGPDGP